MSPLLIQEPPLQVLPSLAIKIGLNEAIVLQQLHYLLRNPQFGKKIAEHQWIFNTVEQWIVNYFPFWSVRTMKTIFTNLAKMDLILTCQPEGRVSRRKYYRINTEKLERICEGTKIARSMVQETSLPIVPKSSLPITKTTSKDFVQRENNNNAAISSFSMPSLTEFVNHYLSKMKKDDKGEHLPLVNWLHNQHTWCSDRWTDKPPKDWRNSTGAFVKRYIEYWHESKPDNSDF